MRKGTRITQAVPTVFTKPKPRKQINLDTVDLRNVRTPKMFFPNFYRVGNILGPDAYFHELEKFSWCDVLTYTATEKFPLTCRRLIYCIQTGSVSATEKKIVVGNHAKLVIAYDKKEIPTAFMGSANHTGNGNFNLMYRLSPDESLHMEEFFKRIWETH